MQKLIAFIAQIAALTKDGEIVEGKEFVLENDDAVDTLHRLISEARELQRGAKKRLYVVLHEYIGGPGIYLVDADRQPDEGELIEALEIDYNHRGERIIINPFECDEIQTLD